MICKNRLTDPRAPEGPLGNLGARMGSLGARWPARIERRKGHGLTTVEFCEVTIDADFVIDNCAVLFGSIGSTSIEWICYCINDYYCALSIPKFVWDCRD